MKKTDKEKILKLFIDDMIKEGLKEALNLFPRNYGWVNPDAIPESPREMLIWDSALREVEYRIKEEIKKYE